MFDGQFVFTQLMDFLPRREFNACVERTRATVASARLLVSRSVLVFGVGQLHVSRELARRRDMPAGHWVQAVSCWLSGRRCRRGTVGRCESHSRLARSLPILPRR